ncbi:MAG: SDR family NAD(P)-dependent oxidoreductase [Candidatus Rokubacteria bacterium]|nr:SDR family NAD(P)-dependent oxidoreductase [Candidatus Rokubacteria bacterium]MBI3824577.1 SDR family NAD(P)-dependent oxidoreductase [Candidatus Rokubacteria bacterium]
MSALAGQVALVTGAGRGIGRAVAVALAAEGAAVALAARSRADLAEAAAAVKDAGGRALAIPVDVTQDAEVEALVEQVLSELGRLDVLVTAAGVAAFGPVAGAKPADWDAMLAVNLRAVMVTCRAALGPMLRQRRGTIINVASIAAVRAIAGGAAYAATKAGVVAWSRVLAEEVRHEGVRVGVVLPGAVDTPLWDQISGAPDRARMLRPEDVARAVVLMASLPDGATMEEVRLLPADGIL